MLRFTEAQDAPPQPPHRPPSPPTGGHTPRTGSMMPEVTVAIPVFNSAQTLARSVRSAMAQSLAEIEILIANDGSTDGSAAIADSLAREDSRITVLHIPVNAGKAAAMNLMIRTAKGRWFAVQDADDRIAPNRIATLVAAAEASGADMAADNLYYVDPDFHRVLRTGFPPSRARRTVSLPDLEAGSNPAASFDMGLLKPMVRHSFITEHGLEYFEKARLSEDFYFLLSFLAAGGRGCLLSEPMYFWTMPFSTRTRRWTDTGAGAWRYDYRGAMSANDHFVADMSARNLGQVVTLLQARAAQYRMMIHYLDAQRHLAEGRWWTAARIIARQRSTHRLLIDRIRGRLVRSIGAGNHAAPLPTGVPGAEQ